MKKTLIALLGALTLATNVAHADGKWAKYAITVTNASAHHVLTPPLVVAHKRHFSLFTLGTEASEGLGTLAETGDPSILQAESEDTGMTFSTAVGSGLIFPGTSLTIEIMAPKYAQFSLASMLAGTNDAFIGIKSLNRKTYGPQVPWVLDAGTEMNNEDCAYVPGPPCNDGSNLRTETGEGLVTFHNGIHGVGDVISAPDMDWRNGVAIVSIKRVH
jgi:hypothetical protein